MDIPPKSRQEDIRQTPASISRGPAIRLHDQCSLVHRLSAETLAATVSKGLRGMAVTIQCFAVTTVALSCVVGGGVPGKGTTISAREGKQAAVQCCSARLHRADAP